MKAIKHYILATAALMFAGACDQDFVEINTNPYAVTNIDPALLFAGLLKTPGTTQKLPPGPIGAIFSG